MRWTTLAGLLVMALGSGCTTVRETFPDKTPEQVWTALVAVAETPDYDAEDPADRWHIRENRATVFDESARIEIYRRLQRVRHPERARPLTQSRTWRFQVTLVSTDPPRAKFVSRGPAIPSHAEDEANRYFDDVWMLLGGRPDEQPPAEAEAAPVPETLPEPAEEEPVIDIDDLGPD
jgi:hypothetical protein